MSLRIGSWLELQSSMRQCGGRQCRSGVTTFPLAPRHAFVCWIVSSHVVWPETKLTVMSFPSVEPCRCVLVLWRRLVGLTEHRCYVDADPWRTSGEWLQEVTVCLDVTLDNRVVLAAS